MNPRGLTLKEKAVVEAMEALGGICTVTQVSEAVGFASMGSIKTLEGKGVVFKAGRATRGWRWSL